MFYFFIIVFVLGYLAIALEHSLKTDKLIPALLMAALIWAGISLGHAEVFHVDTVLKKLVPGHINEVLLHHLGKTAEILVFLIGAMTIVETINYFRGFDSIKEWITTKKKSLLLWIVGIIGFILSAIIDNLTATIVVVTILRQLITDKEERLWFVSMAVIAANAGGAWSPIGDVTTTMLWIGGKVTTVELLRYVLLPSVVCMAVPTLLASRMKPFQGYLSSNDEIEETEYTRYGRAMLFIGLGMIVFVPVFKTITHLPPWVGMILSVSIVAFIAEIFSKGDFDMTNAHIDKGKDEHHHPIVHKALTKIEMPSILFFLGILIAVAGLESLGYLFNFATWVDIKCPNKDIVIGLLGAGSAIIDNVPLVAASLGMFSEPVNDQLWHFTAYSAGTGGSMLIIGSAAGVVAMGMEKIDFIWYFRKISWLAATGFVAGGFTFILMRDYVWL